MLKPISEIKELTGDNLLGYKQFLLNKGFDEEIAEAALMELRNTEAPLSDYTNKISPLIVN